MGLPLRKIRAVAKACVDSFQSVRSVRSFCSTGRVARSVDGLREILV